MKIDRLKEIIHIVEEAKVDVLHIEENGFKLYYEKNGSTPIVDSSSTDSRVDATENKQKEPDPELTDDSVEEIVSPMIGTFYSRPEPEEDPYVRVGSTVAEGDTVCVLEAMKLMNEITSSFNGEITEILVSDGEVIEYGQPLFKVKVGE